MARDMERFWDERAREDAAYFVDSIQEYGRADMEHFWQSGHGIVDRFAERVGVQIEPDDDIVEIGCGIGRLTRVLAERGRHVWAFDVSSEMLRRAKELVGESDAIDWIHGDGTSLA